jgi:FkbM family methyltransferase
MSYPSCIFTNDQHVQVFVLHHPFSNIFITRIHHEVIFRRIISTLLSNHIIRHNIVDSGAWIGDNAIPWAKQIQQSVYAIDPSPNNIDYINQMCTINQLQNVKTIQIALSDKTETVTTVDHIDHCSFVCPGNTQAYAVSLDDLYLKNSISDIDFIHLDVEGFESKAIHGSEQLIRRYNPMIAFEQHLHTDLYVELCQYLQDKDYVVYMIDEVMPGCREDCRNFLAIPKKNENKVVEALKIEALHGYLKKM